MVYCAVNVPCHQEPQKYDMVWELATFNLTWCDEKMVIQNILVWMCGCSLAYGCNAFQKMGNIKICRIKG